MEAPTHIDELRNAFFSSGHRIHGPLDRSQQALCVLVDDWVTEIVGAIDRLTDAIRGYEDERDE
jgi:hypothetical protein